MVELHSARSIQEVLWTGKSVEFADPVQALENEMASNSLELDELEHLAATAFENINFSMVECDKRALRVVKLYLSTERVLSLVALVLRERLATLIAERAQSLCEAGKRMTQGQSYRDVAIKEVYDEEIQGKAEITYNSFKIIVREGKFLMQLNGALILEFTKGRSWDK